MISIKPDKIIPRIPIDGMWEFNYDLPPSNATKQEVLLFKKRFITHFVSYLFERQEELEAGMKKKNSTLHDASRRMMTEGQAFRETMELINQSMAESGHNTVLTHYLQLAFNYLMLHHNGSIYMEHELEPKT